MLYVFNSITFSTLRCDQLSESVYHYENQVDSWRGRISTFLSSLSWNRHVIDCLTKIWYIFSQSDSMVNKNFVYFSCDLLKKETWSNMRHWTFDSFVARVLIRFCGSLILACQPKVGRPAYEFHAESDCREEVIALSAVLFFCLLKRFLLVGRKQQRKNPSCLLRLISWRIFSKWEFHEVSTHPSFGCMWDMFPWKCTHLKCRYHVIVKERLHAFKFRHHYELM